MANSQVFYGLQKPPMSIFSLSAQSSGSARDSIFCVPSLPHSVNVNRVRRSCRRSFSVWLISWDSNTCLLALEWSPQNLGCITLSLCGCSKTTGPGAPAQDSPPYSVSCWTAGDETVMNKWFSGFIDCEGHFLHPRWFFITALKVPMSWGYNQNQFR